MTEAHPDDAEEFTTWNPELDNRQGEISELMASNANIRKNYSTLVPEKVIKALNFSLHYYMDIKLVHINYITVAGMLRDANNHSFIRW